MTRYKLDGENVFAQIDALPEHVRDQVYDDLKELEVDPTNKRGDPRSSITEFKDPRRGHTYAVAVAKGRFLIVYSVLQDYPRVWLREIVDFGADQIL